MSKIIWGQGASIPRWAYHLEKNKSVPPETLNGEVITNEKTHSEGRHEKCHHVGP